MCYFVLIRQRKRGRAIGNWEREGRKVGDKVSEKEREGVAGDESQRGTVRAREGGGEREREREKEREEQ